jgi:hypothetical protein
MFLFSSNDGMVDGFETCRHTRPRLNHAGAGSSGYPMPLNSLNRLDSRFHENDETALQARIAQQPMNFGGNK